MWACVFTLTGSLRASRVGDGRFCEPPRRTPRVVMKTARTHLPCHPGDPEACVASMTVHRERDFAHGLALASPCTRRPRRPPRGPDHARSGVFPASLPTWRACQVRHAAPAQALAQAPGPAPRPRRHAGTRLARHGLPRPGRHRPPRQLTAGARPSEASS